MKLIMIASLALTMLVSCGSGNETAADKEKIELTDKTTSYDVKVGEQMKYAIRIHGSVGNQANVTISDEKIVKELAANFEYDNPEKSDMPGGDSGERVYTFEAVAVGSTTIVIEKVYRGEVTETNELTINVIE